MTRTLWLAMLAAVSIGGAWAQAPPASVDRTTPRTQQGLTVLAIVRGDAQGQYQFPVPPELDFLSGPRQNGPPGGIGLWVRGVKPPAPLPPPHQFYHPAPQPAASARALNGDTLPVRADTSSTGSYYDQPNHRPAPLFLLTLPGDYPIGYPAIDVNFSDGQGHSARWRLVRLAPAFHAIAPGTAPKATFRGAGVVLKARAFPSPNQSIDWQGVQYQFDATVPSGTHWLLRITQTQLEWDALRPGEGEAALAREYGGRTMPPHTLWSTTLGDDRRGGPSYGTVQTPYGKYNHFLRLSGELVQMATAQESVTFHDLNIRQSKPPAGMSNHFPHGYTPPVSYEIATSPQTVTTPSGISVTLLPLSALPQNSDMYFGYSGENSARMALKFAPAPPTQSPDEQNFLVLPRSPLSKKYHKPVAYSVMAQPPYFLEYFSGYGGYVRPGAPSPPMMATLRVEMMSGVRPVKHTFPDGRVVMTLPPPVMPKHLNSLTFTVSQRARLRSLPVSFVVPIGAAPPPAVRPPFYGRRPLLPRPH